VKLPESQFIAHSTSRFRLEAGQPFALAAYREALRAEGFALISLDYLDVEAKTFVALVSQLGTSDSHDQLGQVVWHVKYDDLVDQQSGTRSLTLKEFPMHTDASFEMPPPQFVALYVVREDAFGGGVTQLLDSHNFRHLLSQASKTTLSQTLFTITVPEEFRKSAECKTVRAPILDRDGNFRFRLELLLTEDLDPAQLAAVAELEALLGREEWVQSFSLPAGSILLFDNGRIFHARTPVIDKERHLLRMRFR